MKVTCQECQQETDLDVQFEVRFFVCPNCHNIYENDNGFRLQRQIFPKFVSYADQIFTIGQKGMLQGALYTVVASVIKKAYGSFYWNEYTLQDATGNFIFLSESEGHWMQLKPIDGNSYDIIGRPNPIDYDGLKMQLYDFTDVEIVGASGFFDFKINTLKIPMTEYILPPYILSVERINGEDTGCFGMHIHPKVIKKGFGIHQIPSRRGVGIVQPFLINIKNLAMIICVVAILILSSHLMIYSGRTQTDVLSETFTIGTSNDRQFVSPSFTLQGGSAPLTISAVSDIDNSWLNVQVALINEVTGEETYANKDVEYYSGYTDGESWSEGDKSEKLQICGVAAGKYHLLVTPQWAPENTANKYLQVRAVWNEPSMWNVWLPIVIMGGLLIGMYYINVNFEQRRWAESDFSPYDK